ncbi:hypothetical protein GCM10027414_36960 [Humibacter ginsengiterrae]
MLIGIIVLGAASIAVAVGIILCAAGVIRRNPWVGLRIPSLFSSDEAWSAGHRAAVLPVVCSAVVNIVLAVLALTVLPTAPSSVLLWVALIVLLAGTIIGANCRRPRREPDPGGMNSLSPSSRSVMIPSK